MADVKKGGTPVFTLNNSEVKAFALVDALGYPDSAGQYISNKYFDMVKGFAGISAGRVKNNYLLIYIINKIDVIDANNYSVVAQSSWVPLNQITHVGQVTDKVRTYQRIYLDNATSGTLPGMDGNSIIPGADVFNINLPTGLKWLLILLGVIIITKD